MITRETTGSIQYRLISRFCRLERTRGISQFIEVILTVNRVFCPSPPRCFGTNKGIHAERVNIIIRRFTDYRRPVILSSRKNAIEHITINIPLTWSPTGSTRTGFLYRNEILLIGCIWTNLIVIIDEITFMRGIQTIILTFRQFCRVFSSVTTITATFEIIVDIIDIIEVNHPIIALRTVEAAGTFIVVNQQVMVIRSG